MNSYVASDMKTASKNFAMQARARQRIPGMTQLLSKRPDMFSLGAWPGYYQRARGAHVWDLDGNRYLDMSIAGIGANVLGYADPDVDDAVVKAIRDGVSCSLNCPEEVELAELLCELHPWADMVRFTRSGGEAMAVAVRIARALTGRDKIAFCGYHGWHDWYLSANLNECDALGEHLLSGLAPAGVPAVLKNTAFPFRYNRRDDLDAIVNAHGRDLAAVVMEPLRSEKPAAGFVSGVKGLARACGAVFVVDEISAGLRYNTGGAHLVFHDTTPDMAVFSKALGNGYPMAAVIGTTDVMQAAQKTFISSTCWTERTGPAAALATLHKHRSIQAGQKLVALGKQMTAGWQTLADRHGISIHIGGMAPMAHFAFTHAKARSLKAYFIQLMLEQGFLASTVFYAMAAHTPDHIRQYLEAADTAFAAVKDSLGQDDIHRRLKGEPAAAGFKRIA